jgi:hypothetical protein
VRESEQREYVKPSPVIHTLACLYQRGFATTHSRWWLGGLALRFCRWAPPPNEHEDNITWCSHDSNVIFSPALTLAPPPLPPLPTSAAERGIKKLHCLLGHRAVLSFYRMKFLPPLCAKCTYIYPLSLYTTLYSSVLLQQCFGSSPKACMARASRNMTLCATTLSECEIDAFCAGLHTYTRDYHALADSPL